MSGWGHVITDNFATGNRDDGINIAGPGTGDQITRNTVVRNRGAGIFVQLGWDDYAGVITGNNLVGNGLVASTNWALSHPARSQPRFTWWPTAPADDRASDHDRHAACPAGLTRTALARYEAETARGGCHARALAAMMPEPSGEATGRADVP